MPTFLNTALLWGMLLLAVPVLIHLINLFRHRRVPWAAMEFLLTSQKRNSRWILLRQLLLLLLRMAAVAAIVLLLARPHLPNRWGSVFGSEKTHHVVLLDDSFSMTDRWADTSAFDEAKTVISRLGSALVERGTLATFTLLRFSRAEQAGDEDGPDLLEEMVDADFSARLQGVVASLEPSQQNPGPTAALAALERLLGPPAGEHRVVYLVSDFRANEWREPSDLQQALKALDQRDVEIHLVSCVESRHANLAVTDLAPLPGTRAAGVPLLVEISVRNFGPTDVRDVSVMLHSDGQPLPALVLDHIAAESTETRRFSVQFPTAGEHQIVANLEVDAVAADNARHAVVDFPLTVPVLLTGGGIDTSDARILSLALAPGGVGHTGISPQIEPLSFLTRRPLEGFSAIFLMNFERLDDRALRALEDYVRSGGGLAIFLGPQCRSGFINDEMHRDGEGLFPVPLMPPTDLFIERLEKTPDLEVEDHPIFKVFEGQRNSFLGMVNISRYFPVARGWEPSPDAKSRVIARLRNGAPLAVEQSFGNGRVVSFLTTAGPSWNNWAQNPSFVVAMLELQAYLASARLDQPPREVGNPLRLVLDAAKYEPRVRFVLPGDAGRIIETDAVPGATLEVELDETSSGGIYEARLSTVTGEVQSRRFAYNVIASEGDLSLVGPEELTGQLKDVRFEYHRADDFQTGDQEFAGVDLAMSLAYLLMIIVVGEQLLAYAASYHPPNVGGVRR